MQAPCVASGRGWRVMIGTLQKGNPMWKIALAPHVIDARDVPHDPL